MKRMRFIPTRASSSTTYCTTGLRPTGSISFGCDLVAGSRRVPRPATGTTAMSMSNGNRRHIITSAASQPRSCLRDDDDGRAPEGDLVAGAVEHGDLAVVAAWCE